MLFRSMLRRIEEANQRDSNSSLPRYFDVVFWWNPTPNREYSRFWRRHFFLLQEPYHRMFRKVLNVTAWYWERDPKMFRHVVDLTNPYENSSLITTDAYSASSLMSQADLRGVTECLENLGLSRDRPVALLHVRDTSHDVRSDGVSSYDVHCVNANPSSFQMAVDYLNNRGFSVVTIGNHRTSISSLKEIVEYHRSPVRTPLLDFLIGSAASVYLGTATGAPTGVALHFRDRKSTRLNSSHVSESRMPSSA